MLPTLELQEHATLALPEPDVLPLVAHGSTDNERAEALVLTRDAVQSRVERFVERAGLHGARRRASWCARHEQRGILKKG